MSHSAVVTRRKFIALTGATAAHVALYAVPTPPVVAQAGVQSLAGEWRFSLDRDDVGVKENWFSHDLSATTWISLTSRHPGNGTFLWPCRRWKTGSTA